MTTSTATKTVDPRTTRRRIPATQWYRNRALFAYYEMVGQEDWDGRKEQFKTVVIQRTRESLTCPTKNSATRR